MSISDQPPPLHAVAAASMSGVLRDIVSHRGVQAAITLWVVGYLLVLWLADGSLPFDRPAVALVPFAVQMAAPSITLIEIFALMGLTYLVTRSRIVPDMAARAPERRIAQRETVAVLLYASLGQAGGWLLGPALGYRPFSFHIAGTVFGCSVAPARAEIGMWALYNFMIFAVVPYVCFRRRYTPRELNLCSSDRRNDTLLIFVILIVESAVELAIFDNNILRLSLRQVILGAPLTFLIFFIGTVLPTMVLIYSILLPRYLKITGSTISTVLLGGVTYAAMHLDM
jgi:hypothetical protein